MSHSPATPWLHRYAVVTACAACLPIVAGAVVTTMKWGMAFSDWPTSEGHNMFLYPWLGAAADKFTEHGHRLSGALLGLLSIGLAGLFCWKEPRRWVRGLAVLVLLSVIVQGVLGGMRVLGDDPRMALVHGVSAALVFTLIAAIALITGRSWRDADRFTVPATVHRMKWLAVATPVVILAQYVLGGLVRHLGTGLYEHLGFAFVVLLAIGATVVAADRSGSKWLGGPAWLLLGLVFVQLALGAGAWVTKFGFTAAGYVAVQQSLPQVLLRTAHTLVGMLVFMTSVILALRVFRLTALNPQTAETSPATGRTTSKTFPGALMAKGGAG